ncbi:2OG-Fe(II) oxygenase [Pseudofulvibacter geojedonensis]|uniref:2OG-Fe(II) oxygenase n=1 Tax=Pseudofulvibacter geojedonensis TaxID=1123758 RepID=A0ABW3I5B7_9FLAO
MQRTEIANIILEKLQRNEQSLLHMFSNSFKEIGYFYVDDLLPKEIALELEKYFPLEKDMVLKKSLKEYKYVSAQMNKHDPLLEEVLFAFQDERIVKFIASICKIETNILPDSSLYAGGLSLMREDCFLNPHLDNSHDSNRESWRVLNLLYYVTNNWEKQYGGNLELWPKGPKKESIEIVSKFNRLVVMATHNQSWHSVNKVKNDVGRKCISNYYFSKVPLDRHTNFHVTSFKGRPNQKLRNFVLSIDGKLRMGIRKLFKKGIRKNPHIYKKDNEK